MTIQPDIQSFEVFEAAARQVMKPFKSQFGATWFHEAGRKRPKRDWLVKDLILARSFGIIYGPPGCGKSFLLADLMLTCAASAVPHNVRYKGDDAAPFGGDEPLDWFGYRVNPSGVVYVCAEGMDDFIIRLHAWRLERGISDEAVLPFIFLPTGIDLRSDAADTEKLIDEIGAIDAEMRARCGVGVGTVVIDTVSRALAGGNENDSSVMGAFVRNCERIQKEMRVALIGVHHGGKEPGKGPRGHESLLGAADFVFEVQPRTEDRPLNTWTVRKFKAGAAGQEHRFILKPRLVDLDDEGDEITSCVVLRRSDNDNEDADQPRERKHRPTDTEALFLSSLVAAFDTDAVPAPSGEDAIPGMRSNVVLMVPVEAVKAVYMDRASATEVGTEDEIKARLAARWTRAVRSLLARRVIASSKGQIWMTGKKIVGIPVKGVTDAGAALEPAAETPTSGQEIF